jgi:carbon storage regulator CsrA
MLVFQRTARQQKRYERNIMLVLSRKKDETIILKGPNMEDIKITIVRIDNRNKVRIGIEADKEITVLRSELTNEESEVYSHNLSIDSI